jgi:hypothetical protein
MKKDLMRALMGGTIAVNLMTVVVGSIPNPI